MKLLLILCIAFPFERVSLEVLFPTKNSIPPVGLAYYPRIYGGVTITNNWPKAANSFRDFQYMIYMVNEHSGEGCCASLIRRDWVLTAAHCVSSQPNHLLFAGGSADMTPVVKTDVDLKEYGIEQVFGKEVYFHPGYNHTTFVNDIALVKLEKPFTQSNISTIDIAFDKIRKRKSCTLAGWGLTPQGDSFVLRTVKNKKISTTSTGCRYKSNGPFICLNNDDYGICAGDSGSPLVCEGKVAGVASHLYAAETCGDSLEEYYVEISAYKDWIQSYTDTASNECRNSIKRVSVWIVLSFNFLLQARHSVGL